MRHARIRDLSQALARFHLTASRWATVHAGGVCHFSMEPVPRPFSRALRTFRGVARLYFIRRDAAVAIPVEPQDERAWLLDELLASDLAILVFVKITEIGVGQCGVGLAYRCELRRVEMPVAVAIGHGK